MSAEIRVLGLGLALELPRVSVSALLCFVGGVLEGVPVGFLHCAREAPNTDGGGGQGWTKAACYVCSCSWTVLTEETLATRLCNYKVRGSSGVLSLLHLPGRMWQALPSESPMRLQYFSLHPSRRWLFNSTYTVLYSSASIYGHAPLHSSQVEKQTQLLFAWNSCMAYERLWTFPSLDIAGYVIHTARHARADKRRAKKSHLRTGKEMKAPKLS